MHIEPLHWLRRYFAAVLALIFVIILVWQGTQLTSNFEETMFREDLLASIVTSDPDAIIVCDEDQLITLVNHQAADILRLSTSQLLGHRITDFMRPEIGKNHHNKYALSINHMRSLILMNAVSKHGPVYGIIVYPDKTTQPIKIWSATIKCGDRVGAIAHIRVIDEFPDGVSVNIADTDGQILPGFVPKNMPILIEPTSP